MPSDAEAKVSKEAPRYLAVIPARGGSKRIPGKNIALLGGKPLIAHTIEAARGVARLLRVVVSTDDPGIAAVARDFGAEVPGLRPAELACDLSPMPEVIEHALRSLEQAGECFDAAVLLQPTSPFRTSRHIAGALDIFEKSSADTVTAVCPADHHPYYSWGEREGELVPFFSVAHQAMVRQELPPAYFENGAVMVIRRALVAQGNLYGGRTVPYLMDRRHSLDIDLPEDLAWAEYLLQGGSR